MRLKIPRIFYLTFGISVFLAVYFLLSERGIFTYIVQKKEIRRLEERIAELEENNRKIQERIRKIKKRDREYLEYLFRKMGWVRKGEKIMQIQE